MRNKIITAAVAILAIATVVSAQGNTFTTDLKVGSTGQQVSDLQTWLINNGYAIPAISSGAVAKGTFGAQTKAAVQKYQKAQGLPSTGFVGPLTRGKLNAGGAVVATPPAQVVCPAGFTCVQQNGQSSMVSSNPGVVTTTGIAGTLAFTLQSTPANGTSVDKSATVDVARYKLQAGASDMSVSSLAIDLNKRFWLMASTITIKDDAGNVVAQKSGLTQNDFTELIVGSSYRVSIPINGYVIPKSATRYFSVSVTMLPTTDQCSSACVVTIGRAQIRAVDGTAVTDTQTEESDRTFNFTGSTPGVVIITSNENTPPNMLVPISISADTKDVVIGIADFKSQAVSGLLRSTTLYVNTNRDSSGTNITTLVRDIKIKSGDKVYSADSISWDASGSTVVFTNMQIPLPADQKVPVMIMLDINKDTNNSLDGFAASSTLVASGTAGDASNNPLVEDSAFKAIDINDAPIASSDITFSANNSNIDYEKPPVVKLGQPVMNNNSVTSYPMSFTFTIVGGDNTLYISKTASTALATSSSGLVSSSLARLNDVTVSPGVLSGDSSTYYVIPAGSSRTFTYSGSISNTGGTSGLKTFSITGIQYGTSTASLSANTIVYYDYAALKVSPVF